MEENERFDWGDRRALVVRRVDAIAVYTNSDGDIVIRQQRADVPVDAVITLPMQHAYSVIEGIQRQLKGPFVAPLAATGGA
jgi:hypothetical protein